MALTKEQIAEILDDPLTRELNVLNSIEEFWAFAATHLSPSEIQRRQAYYERQWRPYSFTDDTKLGLLRIDFWSGAMDGPALPGAPFASCLEIDEALVAVETIDDWRAFQAKHGLSGDDEYLEFVESGLIPERTGIERVKESVIRRMFIRYELPLFPLGSRH
jgi:hypothetical protein